jgi:hypothetical protein
VPPPLAHTLLTGATAPRETDESTVVESEPFGWSNRDTTRVQRVAVDDRDTVLVDRDGDGAAVSHPPSVLMTRPAGVSGVSCWAPT